jgi:hypothetical protein
MPHRSARLEAIFGCPLDSLNADSITALIGTDVSEGSELEFKVKLFGGSDAEKRDLAGDVAALANTAGGVILLGVDEDDQARAAAAPGVPLSDAEERRMRQVIAANTAPVPRFDIRPVPLDSADPSHGFYVLTVERTHAAPHAVMVNDALRYPRRNGATIRYLTEPEVAEAYRARLAGLAAQQGRTDAMLTATAAALDTPEQAFVVLTAVPEVPGSLRIDTQQLRAFQNERIGRNAGPLHVGVTFSAIYVVPDALVADGNADLATRSKWCRLERHGDGSTSYALLVGRRRGDDADDVTQELHDERIALGIANGLFEAQASVEAAAASGTLLVKATLFQLSSAQPGQLVHFRGHGFERAYGRAAIDVRPALTVMDSATDARGAIATASTLMTQLVQSFGRPESYQWSPDGEVRQRYWSREVAPRVRQWAEQSDIPVTDSVLNE